MEVVEAAVEAEIAAEQDSFGIGFESAGIEVVDMWAKELGSAEVEVMRNKGVGQGGAL